MRKLCLLALAFILAFYGINLIATAIDPAPYVLRDGLLVALLGALLFVLNIPSSQLNTENSPPSLRTPWWLLIAVTILAAGLRLGWLLEESLLCIDSECDRAVQWEAFLTSAASPAQDLATTSPLPAPSILIDPPPNVNESPSPNTTLFTLLTRLIYGQTADALWSLRLSGALLGILTIPLLFAAARQITTPAGALVGATLLALSPWHIWASRTSNPWVVLPLVMALLIWGLLAALRSTPRVWWLIPILALCAYEAFNLPWGFGTTLGSFSASLNELLIQLWHGASQDVATAFSQQPLLSPFIGALALLGWAVQVRGVRHLRFLVLLLLGLLITGVILRSDWSSTPLPSLALALLPCAFIAAAVAADQVLMVFQQSWRPVIRPQWATGLALLLLVVLVGRNTLQFTGALGNTAPTSSDDGVAEMGRLLAERVKTDGNGTTFFAPAAVIASPVTRLLAGPDLQNAQVQPLETTLNTLLAGEPGGNLLFFIPPSQQRLLALLSRFYPVHTQEPQTTLEEAEPLFTLFAVDAQAVTQQQGLSTAIFTDGGAPTTLATPNILQFDWQEQAALDTPFTTQWEGTIRLPATGLYTFGVDGADPTTAFFALQIDGMPILDSAQGQFEQSLNLAKGFYRLDMSYRSTVAPATTPPAPLVVRWQVPDKAWETIPTMMLHRSPLLNMGLLGSYYGNDQWQEPLVDQRKDLVIGPPADLTPPYSVRWQGKVAAARAGEYLFGTVANGMSQVTVNGQVVINGSSSVEGAAVPGYTEGTIYLSQGWHDLEARYAPDVGVPDFQLLWQPAGGAPGPLDSAALAPVLVVGNPGALPQLPLPALIDATLGDDQFALAQATELWQPQVRLPPQNLPQLPFVPLWQVKNGCGAGENQFNQPHGVVINLARSQLYVADTANQRLVMLTLEGQPAGVVQDPQFQEPVDVELQPDGRALILDALAQQIFAVDPATQQMEVLPLASSFYRPRGFTVDQLGNLSIADTGGGRVAALDSSGQPLGDFGGRDSLLGKGQPVDALSVPNGLWAISAEDGRLWRLNSTGSMTAIQRTDTINGPHLAGLPDGSFFVSDPARGLVAYHRANGQPQGHFVNRDFFTWPTGIAAAQQGDQVWLAVVDTPGCTLSVWQGAGLSGP